MKRYVMMAALAVLSSALAPSAAMASEGAAHWSYSGALGPEHWGAISPEYAACRVGANQSPVDISSVAHAGLSPLDVHYADGARRILNNGHTVQVDVASGSSIDVDGHPFTLKQFHFHSPSENRINGRSYPLEVHMVHADADGHLAVVAVMFEQGSANPTLTQLWAHMPDHAGSAHELEPGLSAASLLPPQHSYYRFSGSLTTPPCSEGVRWMVMKQPLTASSEQIATFAAVLHHANNRPLQPLNGRLVVD